MYVFKNSMWRIPSEIFCELNGASVCMGGEDDKTYSSRNLCSLTTYFGREIQATNKLSYRKRVSSCSPCTHSVFVLAFYEFALVSRKSQWVCNVFNLQCKINKIYLHVCIQQLSTISVLSPFQNVGRFDFSKFIVFDMHLDITYI